MVSSHRKHIILGTLWSIGGQVVSLLVLFVTNVWLSRLLSPGAFGQVGIIMFFITIANVLTESGLGGALVRKKNILREDYSTVFVFNLFISIVCFLLLLFSAKHVSIFYKDIQLQYLLIISSLVLIINAFQITQNAKMISEMRFKRKTICRLISIFVGSFIGIVSAYVGVGVWALIYMQLGMALSLTIAYWISEGIFISIYFSKKSFRELLGFGVNTTLASLINTFFDNIYQLILGRYFSVSQVGCYYQAKKLQDVPGGIINMVSQSVIFSSLAKLQDDKNSFYKAYNKIILLFLVALGFISCFIYIYSEQIILLLYGPEWQGAIFYMQLLTIASFFYYQEKINKLIFKVFNQTRKVLYLEFFKSGMQVVSILIGLYFLNIRILFIGFVISYIVGYFINYFCSRKILDVEVKIELVTILKVFLLCSITVLIIGYVNTYIECSFCILFSIPLLIIIYILGLHFLNVINVHKSLIEIKNIRNYIK